MSKLHFRSVLVVTTAAAIVAVLAAFSARSETTRKWITAGWAVGVPLWFWFEYTFLATEKVKNDQQQFERLKYSQELASKVWLGVAAILAAIYFSRNPLVLPSV
jgi:hypothetical protein